MYADSCCLYIIESLWLSLFDLTTISSSCKWMDALEEEFYYMFYIGIERGEISSGRVLHQQTSRVHFFGLKRVEGTLMMDHLHLYKLVL
jgi:hypothetical protein